MNTHVTGSHSKGWKLVNETTRKHERSLIMPINTNQIDIGILQRYVYVIP